MTADSPLRLGMFVMPIHDPRKPMAQCFDEDLELAVQCDALGFDDFWVGEHHTSRYENIVMPEIFLGKVLGLTKSIRVGPAPVCLLYHNPVSVANRLAFLDHLSHGRLNVCFGPGAVPSDLELFQISGDEVGRRVSEGIDTILRVWTSDPPYRIDGEFWQLNLCKAIDEEMGIGILHKPLQQPYPPIFVPSISRASAGLRSAAARGFRFISHHMLHPDVLRDQWITYFQAAADAGRTAQPEDWSVSRNVLVMDDNQEARRRAVSGSMGKCIEYILELTRRNAPTGLSMWKPTQEMSDRDCNLKYFLDDVFIAGDPPHVARQLIALRERIGSFGNLVLVAHDWDDRQLWLRSLELLAKEVVPELKQHWTTHKE